MSRPVIGLPGRRKKGHSIVGWPEALGELAIDLYIADYARAVLAAGGLPLHIPMDVDPAEVANSVDGVVLTGGADVDPALYGAAPETDEVPPEPERDALETELLRRCLDTGRPVLGICRGLQLANVAAGGSLHQHVASHAGFDVAPETILHEVAIAPGSELHRLYGAHRAVNSLHHQTVDRIGRDLVVTAEAPDGTVEGLEHTSLPFVAVQWHPEMMSDAAHDPLFGWIVDRARQRRSRNA